MEEDTPFTTNQSKFRQCENELRDIAEEIAQFECELMSPDCNLEGIKEREAQLLAKQSKLQEKLTQLRSSRSCLMVSIPGR